MKLSYLGSNGLEIRIGGWDRSRYGEGCRFKGVPKGEALHRQQTLGLGHVPLKAAGTIGGASQNCKRPLKGHRLLPSPVRGFYYPCILRPAFKSSTGVQLDC